MNSIKNFMFSNFKVHFDGFAEFINFMNNVLSPIPSAQLDNTLSQVPGFSISEILRRSNTHLKIRN